MRKFCLFQIVSYFPSLIWYHWVSHSYTYQIIETPFMKQNLLLVPLLPNSSTLLMGYTIFTEELLPFVLHCKAEVNHNNFELVDQVRHFGFETMHHTNYPCEYQHLKIQVFVQSKVCESSDHCKQFLCISSITGFKSSIFLAASRFPQ